MRTLNLYMREDFLQKRWPSLFLIQLSKLFRSFSGFMKNHMGKEWSRWTIIAQCEPHLGVWQEGKGIWSDRREMSRWIFLNKNWAQRLSSSSSRKFRQIISWFSSLHRNLMTIYRTERWRHKHIYVPFDPTWSSEYLSYATEQIFLEIYGKRCRNNVANGLSNFSCHF